MSSELFSLIIDCVVLLFLGATIVYAYKLSKNLQDFKAHRSEFDSVIANLIASIDKAERAIHTLKQTSAQEGGELERLINQAKSLSDELKIINETGESLAGRLEMLAEQSSKITRDKPLPKRSAQEPDMPSFMKKPKSDEQEDSHLQSQAEKELLSALRSNKKKGGRKKA